MSPVENLARRRQLSVELVRQIDLFKERGYTSAQIAAKIDVIKEYVRGIVRLLECGEERLICAVPMPTRALAKRSARFFNSAKVSSIPPKMMARRLGTRAAV